MEISSQSFCVAKDRQSQSDQLIMKQWKNARSNFLNNQLPHKLGALKIEQSLQNQIIQQFLTSQSMIGLQRFGMFSQYWRQIHPLIQEFQAIQKHFLKKERECSPFVLIIERKITSLKVIHIQYSSYISEYTNYSYRYSISAFDFFRVINENKQLNEATLKGVLVQRFQQFIKAINPSNKKVKKQIKQQFPWILEFLPSKFLKLRIDAKIQFQLQKIKAMSSTISDLTFIRALLYQLSNITVIIKIPNWLQIEQWRINLLDMWKCLRAIKNVAIEMIGHGHIPAKQASIVRSLIFGELASLTSITKLSMKQISLSYKVTVNDFSAIKQNLQNFFVSNKITHLQLESCDNLPAFPETTTLQLLNLSSVNFRKTIIQMNSITKNSPKLKSIKCSYMQMVLRDWTIDDHAFNQLQTLILWRCSRVAIDNIFPTPSSIKHLKIQGSIFTKSNCLSVMFSKLFNLSHLQLWHIDFGYQLLCSVPSPHLQKLYIIRNTIITNQGMKAVDQKWPNLRQLQLWDCSSLTENIWNICEFRGLMSIKLNRIILGKTKQGMKQLKRRGIHVDSY